MGPGDTAATHLAMQGRRRGRGLYRVYNLSEGRRTRPITPVPCREYAESGAALVWGESYAIDARRARKWL